MNVSEFEIGTAMEMSFMYDMIAHVLVIVKMSETCSDSVFVYVCVSWVVYVRLCLYGKVLVGCEGYRGFTYAYAYIYICMHELMYVCTSICVCVCVCVCV